MTRLRLLVALLQFAAAALAAEVPVGSPPLIGGSLEGLIFDGSHFVLLQQGTRTFLADDGTPLSSADNGESVALASSGRGYLSVSLSHGSAFATRLSARGDVIDTFRVAPATAAALQWDGTRYVLARRDGTRLAVSYIAENGSVSDSIEVANDADAFALAARDGAALVVWSAGGSLFARTSSGTVTSLGDGVLSDVAAGKDGFLVSTLSGGKIVARHVDLGGHLDVTYTLAPSTRGARLARERYAYTIVWPDGNRVRGMRLDPRQGDMNGPFTIATLPQPVDDVVTASSVAVTLVAYASGGLFAKQIDDTTPGKTMPAHVARQSNVHAADALVVWQQETAGGSEIRVNDAVVANGELQDVAWGGGIALIVWRDAAGLWSLRYPIDSAPARAAFSRVVWDGSAFVGFDSDASIASNGSEFLAVWNDGAIIAQQINRNGDLTGERIVVDNSAAQKGTPHVRWDGTAWVVTWPEIVDAAVARFVSMRIGGSKSIIAKAAMPISLLDWSDGAHALYYVRNGRLFMQPTDAARRRAAGR